MEIDYDYLRTGTAIGFRASRELCSNYLSKSTKHMHSGCLQDRAFFREDSEAAKVIMHTSLWPETRLLLSHFEFSFGCDPSDDDLQ